MNAWIYKQTITTPTGSQIDEIECPHCGHRQTVPVCHRVANTGNSLVRLLGLEYKRPSSCYVCGSMLDPDDFLNEKIVGWLKESIDLKSNADV